MQVKFAAGTENERSAVGRERGLLSEVAFDFEGGGRGREDGRVQWQGRAGVIGPQEEESRGGEKREDGNGPGDKFAAGAKTVNGESGSGRRDRVGGGNGF